MEKARKKPVTCNHCGGTLIKDGEELKCLMCGREAGHHCELCIVQGVEKEAKHHHRKSHVKR